MPKHPVPKRKQSKTYSGRRYKTYVNRAQRRLESGVKLVACSNCAEMRRVHYVCTHCGMYRGRQVIDMQKKMEKVTKIQA